MRPNLSPSIADQVRRHELQHIADIQAYPNLATYAASPSYYFAPGSGYLNLLAELRANLAGYEGDVSLAVFGAIRDTSAARIMLDLGYTAVAAVGGGYFIYNSVSDTSGIPQSDY